MELKAPKVQRLSLNNFALFEEHKINFSRGINILIGKNSTGKTLIIKLLYSILSTLNELNGHFRRADTEVYLRDKIKSIFLIERLGRLVTRGVGAKKCSLSLDFSEGQGFELSFSTRGDSINITRGINIKGIGNSVYIPPKEILSLMDRGIIGTLEERKNLMEGVYLDLAKKLDIPLSVGAYDRATERILEKFNLKNLNRIGRRDKEFYVYMKSVGNLESKLLAEGYRKLATVIYLIKNGQIKSGSYLFWDEPEANLNPALSELVVNLLVFLSTELEMQVFVATHDYFIMKYFDLRKKELGDKLDLKFISFYFEKEEEKPSSLIVQETEDLYELKNNPIFMEFEKLLNLEAKIYLDKYHDLRRERAEDKV